MRLCPARGRVLAGSVLVSQLLAGCDREAARAAPAGARPASAIEREDRPAASPTRSPPSQPAGPLAALVIGGGPVPESNEVSLEQDVERVRGVLPAPALVLFAGGSRSPSVRELAPPRPVDALKLALGELFAPRAGRQSRYRTPRFEAERATLEAVERRLTAALDEGSSALVVYIAGHGEQGVEARDNAVALWGGGALSARRLAELHEQHRRPLRLVVTSCFSGGFAELAFAGADASTKQPAPVPRCGLFAGTWDRETSGCDPNPDRRAQESHALHLIHALARESSDGRPLPLEALDLDGDGQVGLLEAHTFARIEARSIDVPTTTSERWLRAVEPGAAPIDPGLLPEEAAVVRRLGASLGLATEAAVEARWAELDRRLAALDEALGAAEDALADSAAEHATLLLERWPVLDDPYHPDHDATLAAERDAIAEAVLRSGAAQTRARAQAEGDALQARFAALAVEEARVLRLRRAYETQHAAAALLERGGAEAEAYSRLLACERAPL